LPIPISKLEKMGENETLTFTKRIEKFLKRSKAGYTPSELSRKLGIKRRTVTAVLGKLAKKGILKKKPVRNRVYYYYKKEEKKKK